MRTERSLEHVFYHGMKVCRTLRLPLSLFHSSHAASLKVSVRSYLVWGDIPLVVDMEGKPLKTIKDSPFWPPKLTPDRRPTSRLLDKMESKVEEARSGTVPKPWTSPSSKTKRARAPKSAATIKNDDDDEGDDEGEGEGEGAGEGEDVDDNNNSETADHGPVASTSVQAPPRRRVKVATSPVVTHSATSRPAHPSPPSPLPSSRSASPQVAPTPTPAALPAVTATASSTFSSPIPGSSIVPTPAIVSPHVMPVPVPIASPSPAAAPSSSSTLVPAVPPAPAPQSTDLQELDDLIAAARIRLAAKEHEKALQEKLAMLAALNAQLASG